MELKFLFLTTIFAISANVECAKILGIFYVPSKSHHNLGSSLLKALAKKGHEVTMVSCFPLDNPLKNYKDIELVDMLKFKEDINLSGLMQEQNQSFVEKLSTLMSLVDKINEHFLNSSVLKNLIESKAKYDVVIQEHFGNEAFLAIPYIFEASTIVFSPIGSNTIINHLTGNSAPYSYVPNIFPAFPDEMTFQERLLNSLTITLSEFLYYFSVGPEQDRLIKKYFPQAPSRQELIKNVSLVLLNTHHSIESPRPYVPNMIQVGGLHVEEPKELQGDLRKFMDLAIEGVIFFSLGSNIKSSELPEEKLDAIIKTFAKLPMKVLWKFETDNLENLPLNVKVEKWLPQNDILAHPNTKLFITHGGLLSTTEAIYHEVPMVGIPFFGDQVANVEDGERKGYLIKLLFPELSEKTFTSTINEVLYNPKYRNNLRQCSAILRDQPLKPIDNAVFWVEYVIRHKGAHHLKTTAIKLEWYQYYLLDVLSLFAAISLTICAIIYLIVRMFFKLMKKVFVKSDSSKKNAKSKKKTKLA